MTELEEKGVKYIRVLPEEDDPTSAIGRSWKSTYLTTTKEKAEEELLKLGSSWEWNADGTLTTMTKVLPAIRFDAGLNRTNQKTFFNSMVAGIRLQSSFPKNFTTHQLNIHYLSANSEILAYTGWNDSRNDGKRAVRLGDDSACDSEILSKVEIIMEDICVAFRWMNGDLLLLDNRTVMHSRRPFTGNRRILTSIARDPDH